MACPFLKDRAASVARTSAAAMSSWLVARSMGPAAATIASYMGVRPPRKPKGRDCRIARRNGGAYGLSTSRRPGPEASSLSAPAATISARIRSAPADWPNMVIWSGSPPNAEMLARIHSSPDWMSMSPRFAGGTPSARSSPPPRNPYAPSRKVMDATMTLLPAAICEGSNRGRSPPPEMLAPPWIHTMTGSFASGEVPSGMVRARCWQCSS